MILVGELWPSPRITGKAVHFHVPPRADSNGTNLAAVTGCSEAFAYHRVKAFRVKAAKGEITMDEALDALLGAKWDAELETFRHAGDGAPVRWLHQVI